VTRESELRVYGIQQHTAAAYCAYTHTYTAYASDVLRVVTLNIMLLYAAMLICYSILCLTAIREHSTKY